MVKSRFTRLADRYPLVCEFVVGMDPRQKGTAPYLRGYLVFFILWSNFVFLTRWPKRMGLLLKYSKFNVFLIPYYVISVFIAGFFVYFLT